MISLVANNTFLKNKPRHADTNSELSLKQNHLSINNTKQQLQLIGQATRHTPLSILLDKKTQPKELYRRGRALMRTYQQQLSDDRGMVVNRTHN